MNDSDIANYTYSASWIVRQTHSILHLNAHLAPVSNDFAITYDSYWNEYTRSLIPVPAMCMILGILAVVILQAVLCFRICCRGCRCMPTMEERNGEITAAAASKALGPRFSICVGLFVVFGILAVVADQMIIVGSVSLTKGVQTGQDSLDYLKDMFVNLNDYGDDLIVDGNQLNWDLGNASATCPQAADLQAYLPTYFDYVNDYLDIVEPVPGQCDDAYNGLQKWGIHYQNSSVWALFGVLLIGIIIYTVGLVFKHKITLQIGIGLSELFMLFLFLFVGIEMAIVMGLADYCMDPIINVQNVVPRDIYNITVYYTTCYGTNPLQPDIDALEQFVAGFDQALDALNAACPGNPYIQACFPVMTDINQTLANATTQIACPPTQSEFNDVLQTGLCDQAFEGVYYIWIGQYISTSMLLVCTMVASMAYQYFGQYWGDIDDVSTRNDNVLFIESSSAPSPQAHAQIYSVPQASPVASPVTNNPNQFYFSNDTSNSLHRGQPQGIAVVD